MTEITREDLDTIREESRESLRLEERGARAKITVHMGTCGLAAGAQTVMDALLEIRQEENGTDVILSSSGCAGLCSREPMLTVELLGKDPVKYADLTENKARKIFEEHVQGGRPVMEYALPPDSRMDFFKHQMLVALRNRGLTDPESVDEYIGRGGYEGLAKALLEMTPEEIIEEVKTSRIRGRGGAGFPTGVKWEFCRGAPGDRKYLVCNADEGDPGAFMDRSILESDPHSVLEGMTIAARAIGASQGIVYVRDEYPLAMKRLEIAIDQSESYGLLGEDILGSGWGFRVRLVRGGGAFVCGEETALIASLQGLPGRPRPRPPFPAQKGLWESPTVINNVETLANIPVIIQRGGAWYAGIGTDTSRGTKVFSLVGKVNNTGLVEVPMGTPLRTIIFDIGGGVPDGKKFKAVQTGGPSGGCIPEALMDLPVDYEQLTKAGSIMGSGGLIVMDESSCMVDVARYFLGFLMEESCGKCTPCREGILRMHEILTDITRGKGTLNQLDLLQELALVVKDASLCGLGATAPNPVLTTLKYFRPEYEAHITDLTCPAGVCPDLITYRIDPDLCTGCLVCKRLCPSEAITGERQVPHSIDAELCIKCGACEESCRFHAVIRE
ncbi:MAG: NADH-ubiquinone oxidoreductase-F iron-sulfur binding region domain-containing protein [Fidelibacterota bacterium]